MHSSNTVEKLKRCSEFLDEHSEDELETDVFATTSIFLSVSLCLSLTVLYSAVTESHVLVQ